MLKPTVLRNLLLWLPAIVGLGICYTSSASANPVAPKVPTGMERLSSFSQLEEGKSATSKAAQVTSVSQLSDVKPTDWAFQALQSLVERYGCIAGYPDGTFRGGRPMTRYEFAAGLNSCMDRINELIASATSDLVTKEDLDTLRRLQEEFAAELATLRGRVDALEARTAKLEAQQFSTTTKLSGLVFFNLTGVGASRPVEAEGDNVFNPGFLNGPKPPNRFVDNPALTFSALAWLNFNTSFSGKDTLVTQLAVGNGISPVNTLASAGLFNTFGTPFTDQTAFENNGGFLRGQEIQASTQVVIREFFYSFPASNNIQVVVGPRVNWYRYFDNNRYNFFLFGSSSFNSGGSTLLNGLDRGSGAVVLWDISPQLKFNVGYLGSSTEFVPTISPFNSASDPRPTQGLFGGLNTITAELTLRPIPDAAIRLLYNRTNIGLPAGGGYIGTEPIYGFAADTKTIPGVFSPLGNAAADTFSVNFDWQLAKGFGIFGRYGYANTDLYRPFGAGAVGNIGAQSYHVGFALSDIGKPGALATFSYLVPYTVTNGRNFLASGGGNGGKQYELEFTYYYPLSDNIGIAPALYIIAEPNNISSNPPIYVGNFRTQFSF